MKRIIVAFQKSTGLTVSEATVVLIICVVLTIGWVGQALAPKASNVDTATIKQIADILDSLHDVAQEQQRNGIETAAEDSKSVSYPSQHASKSHNKLADKPSVSVRINLNKANKGQLMRLPGVGPATADKIIEARRARPFQSPQELLDVKGIGPAKLAKILPYVSAP